MRFSAVKNSSRNTLSFIFTIITLFFPLAEDTYALEFRDLSATELVQRSTQIVHAACLSAEGIRMSDGDIYTLYTFSPHAVIKGAVTDPFSFRLHGGAVGDESVMIADMPTFSSGTEYVLLLENGRLILSGSFQVTSRSGRPGERVLSSIPQGLDIHDADSERSLASGSEVSVDNFFFSLKKLMSENR